MALQKQVIDVILGQGIDTKSSEELLNPGKLHLLENGYVEKTGAITKRPGMESINTALAKTGGANYDIDSLKLIEFNNELVTISTGAKTFTGTHTLYSYSETSQKFAERGPIAPTISHTKDIGTGSLSISSALWPLGMSSSAYLNQFVLIGYEVGTGIDFALYDTESESIVNVQTNNLGAATGTAPKVLAFNSKFYLLYRNGANIYAQEIDQANPNNLSTAQLVVNDAASDKYDVIVSSGNAVVLAYHATGPTARFKTFSTLTSGTPAVALTPTNSGSVAEAPDTSISIWEIDSGRFAAAWHTVASTNVRTISLNANMTTYAGPATIVARANVTAVSGGFDSTSNRSAILYTYTNGLYPITMYCYKTSNHSTVAEVGTLCRNVAIISKPFIRSSIGANWYVMIHRNGSTSAFAKGYYLLTFPHTLGPSVYHQTITRSLFGEALTAAFDAGFIPTLATSGNGKYWLPVPRQRNSTEATAGKLALITIELEPPAFNGALDHAILGNELFIANGILNRYDGLGVSEVGFLSFPVVTSLTQAVLGGFLTLTATYQYCAVFARIEKNGERTRSAPSIPVSITLTGANDTITVLAETLKLSNSYFPNDLPDIVIEIYRTTGNGTVFYLVQELINLRELDNATAFIDGVADSTIISKEILYTTGGVLENIVPSSATCICEYRERVAIGGTEFDDGIYLSKKRVKGKPVEFSDALFVSVSQRGGKTVALREFGDRLIIFRQRAIYYLTGDGPNATGNVGTFTDPSLITDSLGCESPRSLIEIPQGLMFKSEKGFYLLDQGLGLSYIGRDVEYYNNSNVVGAAKYNKHHSVMFALYGQYKMLQYDFLHDQWGSALMTLPPSDLCTFKDTLVFGTDAGTPGDILIVNPAIYQDGGSDYSMKIRTGWISFAGLQGFQRVYRLIIKGRFRAEHQLDISLYYDYNPEPFWTFSKTPGNDPVMYEIPDQDLYDDSMSWSGGEIYQFRLHLPRQKCESIKVGITEYSSGAACSIMGLAFEVGAMPGAKRLHSGVSL